jgi:hypothetical protein
MYSIQSCFVGPWDALWEALGQHDSTLFFGSGGRQHKRCLPIVVPTYRLVLMARLDQELLVAVSAVLAERL